MTELEEARAFFARDLYASEATGCVIDAVGDRYARCSLTLQPYHRNAVGQVMGGVSFTLADFAFAVTALPEGEPRVLATKYLDIRNGAYRYRYAPLTVL